MVKAENKNAPMLGGWMIGAAMGALAVAVAILVGEYRYTIAGFIGALVALASGLVMGMPWGAGSAKAGAKAAVKPMAARIVAAPLMAAPAAVASGAAASDTVGADAAGFAAVPQADVAAPAMAPASLMAAPAVSTSGGPEQLAAPRGGKADDLKEIEGIGPALEKLCNELGFYHFDQIAGWSDGDVAWVDANMKTFKGRILRDKWVSQARIIVADGLDAFRIRAKTNDY